MRTDNPAVVAQHEAKVYAMPPVGAPPMSTPHLDTRVVDGKKSLLFGPYAGFNTKYLKHGSLLDFFRSLKLDNLGTYFSAGLANLDLVVYLVKEVFASKQQRFKQLLDFYPEASIDDWRLITAGQRVQVMKKGPDGKGVLQMGTEVIASQDGTISGLMGASPGASVAVPVMIDLLRKCFPAKADEWAAKLSALVPSYGNPANVSLERAHEVQNATAGPLGIDRIP